jgi:Tol biopolymer transport system component
MKRHTRLFALCALLLCTLAGAAGARQATRPLTVDEILKFRRVGDPQLSPDGRLVAYTVSVPDLAANRGRTRIYVVPVAGGTPTPLSDENGSASSPRWSPDGRRIAYVSGGQIHTMSATGTT